MAAMSGGVDSSVAAASLVDAGHDVTGVTMKLWGGPADQGCCSVSDVDDARRVAQQLGLAHHVFNFGDEFLEHVVGPYVDEHAAGRTPNPCVECNRHIKFDRLLQRAEALGYEAVATGHHARLVERPDGTLRIARGADRAKDQSYVLHMLGQEVLTRLVLPVGDLTKDAVREIASARGLRTAGKPDSQDVCFITREGGREAFLGERIPLRPGRVVDTTGSELGHVPAVQLVTIGQRRGLGLEGTGTPRYVTEVDVANDVVTVAERAALLDGQLTVHRLSWAAGPVDGPVEVQCSAHGRPRGACLELDHDARTALVRWADPQPRVAPGQSVVFYRGDEVEGGGVAGGPA